MKLRDVRPIIGYIIVNDLGGKKGQGAGELGLRKCYLDTDVYASKEDALRRAKSLPFDENSHSSSVRIFTIRLAPGKGLYAADCLYAGPSNPKYETTIRSIGDFIEALSGDAPKYR